MWDVCAFWNESRSIVRLCTEASNRNRSSPLVSFIKRSSSFLVRSSSSYTDVICQRYSLFRSLEVTSEF